MMERAGTFAESLTDREKYHIRNIRIYKGTKSALHRIEPSRLFNGVQKRLSLKKKENEKHEG